MSTKYSYTKKISSEEEREGYFLVLKNKLSAFPPKGEKFNLVSNSIQRNVSVESYHCQCRGPELPHEHYFVKWSGLKQGQKVVVSKNSPNEDEYQLTVE
jgi:hypothetical protein